MNRGQEQKQEQEQGRGTATMPLGLLVSIANATNPAPASVPASLFPPPPPLTAAVCQKFNRCLALDALHSTPEAREPWANEPPNWQWNESANFQA